MDFKNEKENLSRLIVAECTFLTLREKKIFLNFLLDDDFCVETDFDKRFLSLKLDDVSFIVKRVFKNANWNPAEIFRKVRITQKIMCAQNIKSTCILDGDFPALLREMKDSPFMLFYRGNLNILERRCVSVVGTRRALPSALRAASEFSKDACDDGECVVSGLAFGIDAAAHKGAVSSTNPATAAVLPSGIDIITPHTHIKLAEKILKTGGLIISEYLPGTTAAKFRYIQRNRIVAALSPATVVVQAPTGSGAMITANLALDYNRDIFFHNECFSQKAQELDSLSKKEAKTENCPQFFVEEGANIISGYEDFKRLFP